ncbi:DUF501 domain-containing protein [Nocardiopsis sp. RSe5-2]|uniref:DUF501 domain-containing protein n=1 Tax=Nocardiopsis endophytica TaxID=3018445 RepID=A0ABT4U2S3_9ACTN|nr:DUF501 domain-containing protein [Nocardiopsis endophytica]MDA2811256.1 DUF501 domain-containing protein [Nocardiopsis endophytica]
MTSAEHTTGGPAVPGHASPEPDPSGAVSPEDVRAVERQLGRAPRGLRAVAHRCPCGLPDVVRTAPRLEDGSPFPTLYYLTCPRANSAIGSLEGGGAMRRMQERLGEEPGLREAYRSAHEAYIAERDAQAAADGLEPLPRGMQSAGGMPDRVKCLHALAAHELAEPGTNPVGREALDALPDWWEKGPCVCAGPDSEDTSGGGRP